MDRQHGALSSKQTLCNVTLTEQYKTWLTFVQACATARSQLSGKEDADPAATARALKAAAKAGQAMTSLQATEPCPVRAVVPARQPSCKPSSLSQKPCDPCIGPTPSQELPNGRSPTSFKVASALKQWARPVPAFDKVSGVAANAEAEAADRKLTKPAAEPSSMNEKESKSPISFASPHGQIKGSRAQTLSAAGAWDQMTPEEITDALF